MKEMWVQCLDHGDPLEEEMATHSSILAWKIPWTQELAWYSSRGHKELDTTEHTHTHTQMVYWYTIKCLPSLIIRETKFRATMRYHHTPFRIVTTKTAREHVLTRAWRKEEPCTLLTEIYTGRTIMQKKKNGGFFKN